ncbi:glycosyltransferase family 2 protein [Candidatus Woesearchaeota archaeon]|nr:glycosyltransferase family 2 protein [Candidatus Woesearchaeota archaeon]
MVRISACLVIYNEERVIARCLDSLKGAVDEIIIVHDGPCTDRTLDIARKYTKKIFIRPRVGEAEPHRPFAFSKGNGDWLLQVDADEYFSEDLRKGIRALTRDKDANAFAFATEVFVGGRLLKRVGLGKGYHLCFFRKGKFHYKGYFHEIPRVDGKIKYVDLTLHHRPLYDNYSFFTFRRKWLKWARRQAAFTIEKGNARFPSFFYLLKAPLWLILYIAFFSIRERGFLNGFAGLKISVLQGLYAFFVNLYIFSMKLFKKTAPRD